MASEKVWKLNSCALKSSKQSTKTFVSQTSIGSLGFANPSEPIEVCETNVLVLCLEDFKAQLLSFHTFSDAIRPRYQWLVSDALSGTLPNFPVTVPGEWGPIRRGR